jgi:hypothetical protein
MWWCIAVISLGACSGRRAVYVGAVRSLIPMAANAKAVELCKEET